MTLPHADTIYADGLTFVDVQAAIQAAWLANDLDLAADIAVRYCLKGKICLSCATRAVQPSLLICTTWWWDHICGPCRLENWQLMLNPRTNTSLF